MERCDNSKCDDVRQVVHDLNMVLAGVIVSYFIRVMTSSKGAAGGPEGDLSCKFAGQHKRGRIPEDDSRAASERATGPDRMTESAIDTRPCP